jgi:hypothetical protein
MRELVTHETATARGTDRRCKMKGKPKSSDRMHIRKEKEGRS